MYCTYALIKEKYVKGSTRRGDYTLRELHTKQNEDTPGGGYTWRGLHTMQNENKREAESTLKTVWRDHRRGRAQLEETTYGRD